MTGRFKKTFGKFVYLKVLKKRIDLKDKTINLESRYVKLVVSILMVTFHGLLFSYQFYLGL